MILSVYAVLFRFVGELGFNLFFLGFRGVQNNGGGRRC